MRLAAVPLCLVSCLAIAAPGLARERLLLDPGWRFHLGDLGGAQQAGAPLGHWRWKVSEQGDAEAASLAAPGVDTTAAGWQDAEPQQDVFHGRHGFVWYRTTLPTATGAPLVLSFEGVDDNATVYLNGQLLGRHQGWNDSFELPVGTAWKAAGPNELAVLVENTDGPGSIGRAWLTGQRGVGTDHPAARGFDDSAWRTVDVPHDFVVESPVQQGQYSSESHGFRPGGIGWYRRTFDLPGSDRGKRLWLEFDGIYRNSRLWLNGLPLGQHASGYTSFHYDITNLARPGERNVLTIRVDARQNEGWWYEGGGIYRHVWLTRLNPLHVDHWGTFVTAEVPNPGDGRQAPATVTVRTTLVNDDPKPVACLLRTELHDADDRVVASQETAAQLAGQTSTELKQVHPVAAAQLWSDTRPYLYNLVTTVLRVAQPVDSTTTPCGVRTFRFDADRGFLLNGRPVKIKGCCNHQDFAGVGVALPDRLHVYKIERLKEMGSNGYRCSHHPPAPELLDACDRLGMIVMDENRFLGDSEEIRGQVESLVRRDRNHPSVILWSLCNEEWRYQGTPEGERMGRALKTLVNSLDGTRPITAAMNGEWGNGLSHVVDVQGCNYHDNEYDKYHQAHPQHPMIGSESASIVTTRGIYSSDPIRGYVSALSDGAERTWRPVAEREFMAGTYIWTGFDYRGEPTPYGWPCVTSHFGAMDLCGFPKDDYYYYQAWWGDRPVVHLFPHWTWAYPDRGDKSALIEVRAYSNCDQLELIANGVSQGKQDVKKLSRNVWKVRWKPGTLVAKGYRGGEVVAEDKVETASAPAALQLTADRPAVAADGEDVAVITVKVLDAKGRFVPTADDSIQFAVSPNARILGVGNGDPSSREADRADHRRAFGGRAMVIVQAGRQAGPIKVTAQADGLEPAVIVVDGQAAAGRRVAK